MAEVRNPKEGYTKAISKIVNRWVAKKDKLPELYRKKFDEYLRKLLGKGLRPEVAERYEAGVKAVSPEFYKAQIEKGAEKYFENWSTAVAV